MAFASSGQDLSYCIFVLIYSVLMEQVPGRGGIPLPERSGWSLWVALWEHFALWRGSTAPKEAPPVGQS